MSSYVMVFRAKRGGGPDPEQEAAWGRWLGAISDSITERGHRVGGSRVVGDVDLGDTVLGGYIVVTAESMEDAVAMAQGCPGLRHGGAVDLGEVVE